MGYTRRTYLERAVTSTLLGAGAAGALSSSTAAQSEGRSHFGLDDGFADTAWIDTEDVTIYRVREATREAVEAAFHASGPRVVIFETSGTIDLGGDRLQITEDRCWVAGQTAPSPGITFVRGMLQVDANDCVIQHVRSRIGPGSDGNIQGNDSINTQDETTNNVIDHCTASWGTDECMSVGYDTDRTTYSNNLIYEGLYDPYGDGSDHNYATLVGDGADRVALLGNVWSKIRNRVPRLKSDTRSVVANNFAYFFDEASNVDDSAETAWVGNVYTGTAATGESIVEGSGTVYSEDNVTADPALDSDVDFVEQATVGSAPLWPDGLEAMASSQVEQHNLSNAGARPADRTEHDRRIVQEIRDRAGNDRLDSEYDYWIPHPDAVGGYPELSENTHSLSPPSSGLRTWLMEWAARVETGDGNVDPGDGTTDPGGGTDEDTTAPSTPSSVWVTGQTDSSIDLAWEGASDSGGSSLAHYVVTVGDRSQEVPGGTTSATVSNLEPDTTYEVAVRAVDGAGNESPGATLSATTESVDEDRTGGDGPITVDGAGADIWSDADAFHFYYAAATDDFDVAVRVDGVENTDEYAKAGLMVRDSLDADARNLLIRRTPTETSVQWRPEPGADSTSLTSDDGESESEVDGGTTDHAWQRLVRSGDSIRAYGSDDGRTWTLLAAVELAFGTDVYVGLAVTSHATGTLATGEFDTWSGPTLSDDRDVGDVSVAGSVTDETTDDGEGDGENEETPPAVGDSPPQDLDGNGLYVDVNGNGRTDSDDVVTFFDHLEGDAVQNNPDAFDFNGSGSVGFEDVIELFNLI